MARPSRARRLGIAAGAATLTLIAVLIATSVTSSPPQGCVRFSSKLVGKTSFPAPPCRMIEDGIVDATLETSLGDIDLQLDTRLDGLSVNNFYFLARVGFYDGITIHRVEADDAHAFIQTGDRSGTGRGTAGYTFKADPPSPITQYIRGMVAMAHPPGKLGATSSQFFIIVRDWAEISGPQVTPEYPFFGFIANRDSELVLDKIIAAPRDGVRPDPPIVVRKVTVTHRPFAAGEDE